MVCGTLHSHHLVYVITNVRKNIGKEEGSSMGKQCVTPNRLCVYMCVFDVMETGWWKLCERGVKVAKGFHNPGF